MIKKVKNINDKLFSILNPFPKEQKRVYGKIIELEENEDTNKVIVKISLTNDEMFEFDNDIYGSKGLLNSIIQYFNNTNQFSETVIDIARKYHVEDDLNLILNNQIYDIKKDKKLLMNLFDKFSPYFYEFTAEIQYGSNEYWILWIYHYLYDQHFFEFMLICNDVVNIDLRDEENYITGNTLFSASPIVIKKSQLQLVDPDIDNIYKVDKINNFSDFDTQVNILDYTNISDVTKFKNALNNCLPKLIRKIEYTMYHVGQGLCSYLSFNRNFGWFYDVGFSEYGSNDHSIKFNSRDGFERYKDKHPKVIVLSHWDSDHILGVVYCNKEIYNRIWVAPNINEFKYSGISNSALRLSKYISLREQLLNIGKDEYEKTFFLIDENYNDNEVFVSNMDTMRIHRGKGTSTSPKGSNKKNNVGLILEIVNKKKILLTGDVDYFKMPKSIINKYFDYLQVPHHGARVGNPIFHPRKRGRALAMVPVSKKNKYGHPSKNNLRELKRDGFKIHRTDYDGEITIKI